MVNQQAKQRLLLIFTLLFLFSLIWALWPFIKNPTSVTEAYTSAGALAPVIFLVLVAIAPTPGAIVGASGAAYFGLWQAMLLLYIGNVLAVLITFGVVRYFGRPAVERFLQKDKLAKADRFLAKHPLLLWFVYAFPIFPLEIITAVVALSKRPLKRFIIIPLLALPIDALIVTTIGNQLSDKFHVAFDFISIAIVLLLSYAIIHFIYRWKREEIHATGKKIGRQVKHQVRNVKNHVDRFGNKVDKFSADVERIAGDAKRSMKGSSSRASDDKSKRKARQK